MGYPAVRSNIHKLNKFFIFIMTQDVFVEQEISKMEDCKQLGSTVYVNGCGGDGCVFGHQTAPNLCISVLSFKREVSRGLYLCLFSPFYSITVGVNPYIFPAITVFFSCFDRTITEVILATHHLGTINSHMRDFFGLF